MSTESNQGMNRALLILIGLLTGILCSAAVQYFLSSEPRTVTSVDKTYLADSSQNAVSNQSNSDSARNALANPDQTVGDQKQSSILEPSTAGPLIMQPGTCYSETASGYPISTGGRAVDFTNTQTGPIESFEPDSRLAPQPIGRNGLLSNPSVDPPSSRGHAYSMGYQ